MKEIMTKQESREKGKYTNGTTSHSMIARDIIGILKCVFIVFSSYGVYVNC